MSLEKYLDIANIADRVDVTTSSGDVKKSKHAPDIFEEARYRSGDAVVIGDTPYDPEAVVKAKIATSACSGKGPGSFNRSAEPTWSQPLDGDSLRA